MLLSRYGDLALEANTKSYVLFALEGIEQQFFLFFIRR